MRSLELTVDDETARSLAVEADLLDFDEIESYLGWLVANRFAVEDDSQRGRRLGAYARRRDDIDADADVAAVASAAAGEGGLTIAGEEDTVARIEDRELEAAADALSSVEGQRFDEFVQRAVTQTREQLGDGLGSGIDYSSRETLSDDRRLGEDITDLDELDVPGWDDDLQARRRRAVGAALAYLKDVEEATRSDFVDELYDDYPAGYASQQSWWSCIKQGLRQVDRVDPAREESRTWRFRTTPGRVTRISYV
ncbi:MULTISPECIES: hypothetical protein [Haloarcula]|uniref:hypothetical protein n=1 Tax=Haloarcula TaxID=2237 RepID=UPI0023E3892B|nr:MULTISPECIES: hypothetical protein [Haloarculaceae]